MPHETRKRTVALVDFHVEGHHSSFIFSYAQALLESGNEVWVFYPDAVVFDELKKTYSEQIKIYPCTKIDLDHKSFLVGSIHKALWYIRRDTARSFIASLLWIKSRRAVERAAKKHQRSPDHVIFMCIDNFISVPFPLRIAGSFPYPWSGLCINLKKGSRFKTDWKNVGLSKLDNCKSLFVLDETAVDELQAETEKPVYFLPDVTDESKEENGDLARKIAQKAAGRKIILMAGTITSRKGIISLIRSIRASDPQKFFFIIAGKLYTESFEKNDLAEVNDFFAHPPENCLVLPGRIEDGTTFNTLVRASDIVYASYISFMNSSNILTKTALFGKPVIVSKNTLMSKRIEKFGLGIAVDPLNIAEIVRAYSTTKEKSGNAGYKDYFSLHSFLQLKNILNESLG